MSKQIVNLYQFKSWFIPADADSYSLMRGIGLPLLKFHSEMIETIKLATMPRGIELRACRLQKHLDAKFDALGAKWQSRAGRKCQITDRRLTFVAELNSKNKKAINEVDHYLSALFARWGFYYDGQYSETHAKIKLVGDYHFDSKREPKVPLVEEAVNPTAELVLGFNRIHLTFFNKATDQTKAQGWRIPVTLLEFETQAGTGWSPIWSGTFNHHQIGDLTSFIKGISMLQASTKG